MEPATFLNQFKFNPQGYILGMSIHSNQSQIFKQLDLEYGIYIDYNELSPAFTAAMFDYNPTSNIIALYCNGLVEIMDKQMQEGLFTIHSNH